MDPNNSVIKGFGCTIISVTFYAVITLLISLSPLMLGSVLVARWLVLQTSEQKVPSSNSDRNVFHS